MKPQARYKGQIQKLVTYHTNDIVSSHLSDYSAARTEASMYCIKYVAEGSERYMLNSRTHEVGEGQYLLVNKGQSFECNFRSSQTVHGFCIGLDEKLLAGIHYDLSQTEETLLENPFNGPELFEGFHQLVYSKGNALSQYMRRLNDQLVTDSREITSPYEVFYEVGVELLKSHKDTSERIAALKASRASTKKELYARLEAAKQILELQYDQPVRMADVASQAALSEFHFYRSFKTVYGISPHQFLLRRKIERSAQLIAAGELTLTEIAYQAGFSDIHAFSKAFRQHRGSAPSRWMNAHKKGTCP